MYHNPRKESPLDVRSWPKGENQDMGPRLILAQSSSEQTRRTRTWTLGLGQESSRNLMSTLHTMYSTRQYTVHTSLGEFPISHEWTRAACLSRPPFNICWWLAANLCAKTPPPCHWSNVHSARVGVGFIRTIISSPPENTFVSLLTTYLGTLHSLLSFTSRHHVASIVCLPCLTFKYPTYLDVGTI
ncbi:hypothetical protein DM02DRAFT_615216 [Periconia macrospinosa]|uniref:Uncharacterized protein n=1 Tax=Periconia macrospinosa TaxID=97972 RepID=A0A2V1DPG6_9PLEO|nr:hypothetical protein DM02DRAFT_615216 [Periconia macrospinosa]